MEVVGVLWNVIIYTVVSRVGKVINGTPFLGVLFRDNTNRMTIEKGAHDPT